MPGRDERMKTLRTRRAGRSCACDEQAHNELSTGGNVSNAANRRNVSCSASSRCSSLPPPAEGPGSRACYSKAAETREHKHTQEFA